MTWLFAIMIVLAMGGIAMVAAGRGGSMAPAYDDRPDLALPADRPLGVAQAHRPVKSGVRFSRKAAMPSFWSSLAKRR